jgi:hypothetical protein
MDDVHTLFSDLSEISTAEVNADCGSWWKALPKVAKLLLLPDSRTDVLLDESGTPLAIFGHYPSKQAHIRTTWFVFSKPFIARGLAATRLARRYLKTLQLSYPRTEFHSYTLSSHPGRDRWFTLIGMTSLGKGHYVLPYKISDLEPYGLYNPPNPRAS